MPRRQSYASPARAQKSYQNLSEKPDANKRIRFWLLAFLVAFFVVERATVFAAPTPPQFAEHIQHQQLPRDADNPDLQRSKQNDKQQPPFTSAEGPAPAPISQNDRQIDVTHAQDDNVPGENSPQQNPSEQPQYANIAYFMQISESTVDHLPRLLKKLYHEKNVYAIHFDLKIPDARKKEAEQRIRSNPQYRNNVHIMPSELIIYRGVSMLLNTINAIRLLLDVDPSWHYFINLSGADYPLVTVDNQRRLLGQKLGLNYFTFAPRRTWDSMAENRLAEVWYDEALTFRKNATVGELTKLHVRNPLVDDRDFEVSHAEAWMISSREFCDFVVRGDMARKMLVAFAYAVDSSEHYFASLAWNHEEFKKSIVPHSMRLIVWMHNGVLAGQHPYYVDDMEDDGSYRFKGKLYESVLFFARKFRNKDSKLMDMLDERAESDKAALGKVEDHLTKKISSRGLRVSEL